MGSLFRRGAGSVVHITCFTRSFMTSESTMLVVASTCSVTRFSTKLVLAQRATLSAPMGAGQLRCILARHCFRPASMTMEPERGTFLSSCTVTDAWNTSLRLRRPNSGISYFLGRGWSCSTVHADQLWLIITLLLAVVVRLGTGEFGVCCCACVLVC